MTLGEEGNTISITDNRADLPQLSFMPPQPERCSPHKSGPVTARSRSGMLLRTHWNRDKTRLQPAIPQVVLQLLNSNLSTHFRNKL